MVVYGHYVTFYQIQLISYYVTTEMWMRKMRHFKAW